MKSVFQILVVMAMTLCLQSQFGLSLRIDIQPSTINEIVPRDVVIKCSFDHEDKDAVTFDSIEVVHDTKLVARLEKTAQVAIGSDFQNKITANGEVADTISQSYLQVTVKNARSVNAGTYTCNSLYSTSSELREKMETATLAFTEPDMGDAVKQLLRRVSDLELELEQQENDLKRLSEKENKNILFVASHNRSQTFEAGLDMVFSDVVVNEGQGYHRDTGVFKAPVDGYYLFRISLFSVPKTQITVYLNSNEGRTLTKMHIGMDVLSRDFADTSCVAKLTAGEEVKPYIRDSDEFIMESLDFNGLFNTFSGYLLKAL